MSGAAPRRGLLVPQLLERRAREDGARPLLTLVGAGGQVELSGVTTANWVAKSACLLRDELDVGPGDVVALRLPLHWQTYVLALAAWTLGAVVDAAGPGDDVPADALVVAAGPDGPGPADLPGGVTALVTGLHPWGLPWPDAPAGATDFGAEVLGQPDEHGEPPPDPDAPALRSTAGERDARGLAQEAARLAQEWGLEAADRVLVALAPDGDGLPRGLAPLAAGAAAVLLSPGTPPAAARDQGVHATLGCALEGVRRLG